MLTSPSLFGSTFIVKKSPPNGGIDAPGSGISSLPFTFRSKDNPIISRERYTSTGLWHALTSTLKVNGLPAKVSVHSNDVPYSEQSERAPKTKQGKATINFYKFCLIT